ncbi:hypothetical protein [Salmonirosea aquatica]|uniref:Peptidase n=1 Tax=Salmonirosea aquatica TaxID=2654236 RepID=A0A7C9FZY9_9BACT|nr:hypothetical protein [Cytophagaceae bacterium SJW1-29]
MSFYLLEEELFNEASLPWGGRFHIQLDSELGIYLEGLKATMQRIIDIHQSNLNSKPHINKMPNIHFEFIDNSNFNARAFSYKGMEFIGLNIGVVFILHDVFERMLANRGILSKIGNIDQEDINPERLPFLTTDSQVLLEFYQSEQLKEITLPKNGIRKDYAQLLVMTAILFLLYHELTHHTNGHVELKNELTGSSYMDEDEPDTSGRITPLMNKTLEMDADAGATVLGLQAILHLFQHSDESKPFHSSFTTIEESAIETWGFAVGVLFYLSEYRRRIAQTNFQSYYPNPHQRLIMSLATALTFLGLSYNEEILWSTLKDIGQKSRDAIDKIIKSKFEIIDKEAYIKELMDQSYQKEILKEWKENLRPRLLPFARCNLAPAQ